MASQKNNYNVFSLVLLYLLSIVYANDSSIADCQTPDHKPGTCIPVKDCIYITDILRKQPVTVETKAKLRSYQCGFDNEIPKVCCPHKNIDLINQKLCGPDNSDKIFSGVGTRPYQYPWTTLISYNTESGQQFLCGGSLINENYVLTSAECIKDLHQKLMGVRLGEHDISKEIDCSDYPEQIEDCAPHVQDIMVSEKIPHPNYDSMTLENNIGLLRLSKPANFTTDAVRPICLPIAPDNRNFTYLYLTGWGANNLAKESAVLLHNTYKIVSIEECQSNYSKIAPQIQIGSNQTCLQERNPDDFNFCIGERGDPAHFFSWIKGIENELAIVQFGIMSFSSKICENVNQPKVLTEVASYINWILDNIRP